MERAAKDAGDRPRVVVLGGGFAGLNAARALDGAPVDVCLIDRRNHHLFQPLLYEVATAALAPGEIAMPLRHVLRKQRNARTILAEARRVDLDAREVHADGEVFPYDTLVVATGSTFSYFGHDEWAGRAPGLKSIDDARKIRQRFLLSFERADRAKDPDERARLMTTVIVGGGPTGIELAGTMAEVARNVLDDEFHQLDTAAAQIVLVEGLDRLLPVYPPKLSERARRDLEQLGVEVVLGDLVVGIDDLGADLKSGRRIEAANVFWAAGNAGAPPGQGLDAYLGKDRRIEVAPTLTLPDRPEVFVVGDLAKVSDPESGEPVPGLAPAAIQMGKYVGKIVAREARGASRDARKPFRYRDKGSMATIGRARAVATVRGWNFGGVTAWLMWVFIHIFFLIGFRNRLLVLFDWAYAYVTYRRGSRLITADADPDQ